ncbi:MAG TPA: hypothetical protein VGC54_13440, partial [Planctomycetota bacterium]
MQCEGCGERRLLHLERVGQQRFRVGVPGQQPQPPGLAHGWELVVEVLQGSLEYAHEFQVGVVVAPLGTKHLRKLVADGERLRVLATENALENRQRAPVVDLGFRDTTLQSQDPREVAGVRRREPMRRPQTPDVDRTSAFEMRTRLFGTHHRQQKVGQVVEAGGGFGVVRDGGCRADGERPSAVNQRRFEMPLRTPDSCEVVQALGDGAIARRQDGRADRQRPLELG